MKNLVISIWLMSLSTLVLGQDFPPPENFTLADYDIDSVQLSWNPPSNASPTHYNIYFTTYWHGDIIIKVGTTTQTQVKFPWPDFPYEFCYGISASYENPAGESDTTFACMTLLSYITEPYFLVDFEPNGNTWYLLATRTTGNETWELCTNTYLSPSRSARYISDTPGNSGSLWTANFSQQSPISPNLSFWYKIPQNQGLSDTLKVYLWYNSNLTILMQPLSATEDWQYVEMPLPVTSDGFKISFEATAAGGNGIYLDDLRVIDELVDVKDKPFKTASIDIFPNPASSFFHLNLNLPESSDVKLTICSMEGKVIKTNVNRRMMPGEQSLTMDVSDLKPGIYLVSVQMNDKVINRKLLKY